MDETAARQQLTDLLAGTDPGTLLLLLSEVLDERAEEARQAGDAGRHVQLQHCAHAAYVVGLGMYAVLPRS